MTDSSAAPTICDVSPRDGLQTEPVVLDLNTRRELVTKLAAAGATHIEVGSMVRADRVPAMADSGSVLTSVQQELSKDSSFTKPPTLSLLILNKRGFEQAAQLNPDELHFAFPVTDEFVSRNQGMMAQQAADLVCELVGLSAEAKIKTTVTLAAALGCPFSGEVDPEIVASFASQVNAAGAQTIVVADTIGAGTPKGIGRVIRSVKSQAPTATVGLHLHNTRNAGYANAVRGLEEGVSWFDASVGGFGGCPFAPRATGNVATEDLAWIFEREGVSHPFDLDQLFQTATWLGQQLDKPAPGLLHRAGVFPSSDISSK